MACVPEVTPEVADRAKRLIDAIGQAGTLSCPYHQKPNAKAAR
jgi:hypothetical protein